LGTIKEQEVNATITQPQAQVQVPPTSSFNLTSNKAIWIELIAGLKRDCIIPDAKNVKARWKELADKSTVPNRKFEVTSSVK